MISDTCRVILDARFWMLDEIRNSFFGLSSIEHPPLPSGGQAETSISTPQAIKLIDSHKVVGLRQSFVRIVSIKQFDYYFNPHNKDKHLFCLN